MKPARILAALFALGLAHSTLAAGGGVTAVLSADGVLTVTGDSADNEISITPDATRAFTVTGLNGTTVNLTTAVPFTAVRTIHVFLGAGNDRLEVTGGRIRGDLRVKLEDGVDVCVLTGVRVRGRTSILGGNGADRVVTGGTSVFRNTLTILGEEGNDEVEVRDTVCIVRTRIEGGDGADTVTCKDSDFDDIYVATGVGADTFVVEGCDVGGDLKAETGPDDDKVTLDDSSFDGRVAVNAGGGNGDDLSLRDGNGFDRLPRFRSFEE